MHACVCPLTQGLPFYARHAFGLQRRSDAAAAASPSAAASRRAAAHFEDMAERLGFTRAEGSRAFDVALDAVSAIPRRLPRRSGKKVLREMAENPDRVYVALLGRPYNAFTRDANMGIPRKFTSQGVTVIPFDMIFDDDAEIPPNNYWYYGQQNMKAVAHRSRRSTTSTSSWISNFSCAPDSFMLHYVRWMMGQKPYLVLEIDSHTADAGLDTRVEAFLDIVESYRRHMSPAAEKPFQRRYHIALKEEYCDVVDRKTGERIDIRDPRVHLVWPSMGDLVDRGDERGLAPPGDQLDTPAAAGRLQHPARAQRRLRQGVHPGAARAGLDPAVLPRHRPNRPPARPLRRLRALDARGRAAPASTTSSSTGSSRRWAGRTSILLVGGSENSYRELGPTFSPGCLARARARRLLHRHPHRAAARWPATLSAAWRSSRRCGRTCCAAFAGGPEGARPGARARGGPPRRDPAQAATSRTSRR